MKHPNSEAHVGCLQKLLCVHLIDFRVYLIFHLYFSLRDYLTGSMPAWTNVNKVSSLVTVAANGFTIISLNIRKIAYHMDYIPTYEKGVG